MTGPEAPPGILKNRRKEAEYEIEAPGAQNPLSGTPFSFLFRGFVSDFSVLGLSEAPVFRDEAPEVHEVSLGEPSLLRKEHELEVVEHDVAHEFSEVCSDFEFFPERPKALRKFWHGVSMFELVRKQCSLNFGMLGLFGMIGMTLLLAAVFAFVAFGNQGDDGQFVAYGRECTKGARAEWDADGSRGEWWHDRCAYDAGVGSRHFARDGWSGLGTRAFGARALGERGGFCLGHFAKLCRSRGGPGSCSLRACRPLGRRGSTRRLLQKLGRKLPRPIRQKTRPGGLGEPEVAPSKGRAPDVASSEAQAPAAASSEAQDVRDVKRPRRGIPAGSRARVGAVPTPNESEEDLLKQVFQRELEVRRQEGEALGLRLRAEADEPLPLLPHFYGPPSPSQMYDSLALCLTDRSFLTRVALGGGSSQDPVGGATGITGKGRLCRGDPLYASETASVSGAGAAAATAKAAYRPGDDYRQCPRGVARLAKAGPARKKLERMGIDFFRRGYCSAVPRRGAAAGGACERRSLEQRPPRRPEEAEASAGISDLGRYPALSQESFEMHRLLRWITQWVPRIVAGTIGCNGAGEARWGHGLGRTGGMEVFGGFGRPQSPATLGQKESEEPHGGCYDGDLVADPESSSREAAASAAAHADQELGLLFGGCVRSFGRVPVKGGGRSRVDRYPPLPWDRNAVAARGRHPDVWNTGVAASAVSRGWRCSFGRKECRRRRIFEPSGRNSRGHTGDGTAHAGGNRTEEPGKPGISYLPAREAGGKDAFGVGWFDGTIASWSTTSTCFATTSTTAIEKLFCGVPAESSGASPRANATGKGVHSPLAFGRSIFRAFGRHRFRNRNPIRRLRERSGSSPSCYGKRQSRFVNSFDLCFFEGKENLW